MIDTLGVPAGRLARARPEERLALLGSRPSGLAESDALARLRAHGLNEPDEPSRFRPLKSFAGQFTHTLALLLWFAAGLAFGGGAPELGAAIVAVVVINGVFAFVQTHRAERVVAALMRSVRVRVRVVRDAVERTVGAEQLVPGDVIRLTAGDVVPADAALLASAGLALDLSSLTGESSPVAREATADPSARDDDHEADIASALPAGAAVTSGTAEAVVFATGPRSTLGQVAKLTAGVLCGASVLEEQIRALSHTTALIAGIAGGVTLAVVSLLGVAPSFLGALVFCTGVVVALVPEGLLPTLSVALAVGARRMAARGVAVRRLSAIEVVGAVTVICTDKTGTLTENSVEVVELVLSSAPSARARALQALVLCNDARMTPSGFQGDRLDVALLGFATAEGIDVQDWLSRHVRLEDDAFSADRRLMRVVCRVGSETRQLVKGAPEAVASLAGLEALPTELDALLVRFAGQGDRVVLLAEGPTEGPLSVVGMVRLRDPIRAEVPNAIASCHAAGIRVVMLTGDHPRTARAVAKAIGLANDPEVTTGDECDGLDDRALFTRIVRGDVFARIRPETKLRLVNILKRRGEVVVVTGDGVNDAPALRAADVGVAMGLRGTEVAKQAADLVLADDHFATIVAAIEEGRSIFANIQRFAGYVFTSNVAELVPFLLFVVARVPLPLAIVQVLAIDLGTDLVPALALGVEAPSKDTLNAPPRPRNARLLDRRLGFVTFLRRGPIEAAVGLLAWAAYFASAGARSLGDLPRLPVEVARGASTLTFLGIVGGQIGCLFAHRDGSVKERLGVRDNPWILPSILIEIAIALAVVCIPGLRLLFAMWPVAPVWLLTLPVGAALFFATDRVLARLSRSLKGRACRAVRARGSSRPPS